MQQIADTQVTWQHVKAECDVLDQMASQTVLKACDIGDMLRELRRGMGRESFTSHVKQNLNRPDQWADRMIVLSFRREAVLKALAEGEANDSIRSAYEYVKTLPPPEIEQQEREQWPREKRGPAPGSGGRPAAPAIVQDKAAEPVVPDEPLSPEAQARIADANREFAERLQQHEQFMAEHAERVKANRHPDNIERKHERADRLALDVLHMLRNVHDELDERGADLVGLFQDRHFEEIKTLCIRIPNLMRTPE